MSFVQFSNLNTSTKVRGHEDNEMAGGFVAAAEGKIALAYDLYADFAIDRNQLVKDDEEQKFSTIPTFTPT